AANALYDVRAQVLDWPPPEALRPVGCDVFRCGVQTIRHWTASGLRPEAGPDIVGAPTKQQIKARALCLDDGLEPSRTSIRCRPGAIRVAVVVFDYAVQRDVFEDSDLSHFEFRSVRRLPGKFVMHLNAA